MNSDKKFEYRIALKIYTYDLDNINKEIENLKSNGKTCETSERLKSLYELRTKKEAQISDLHKKYK